MKPGVSKCFEVSSDLAKVGDCQKFIKACYQVAYPTWAVTGLF